MCSSVLIDIYHKHYHVRWKVYRETLQERENKMSKKLNDSVIMRLWSENKSHHHIKDPWTLSEVVCDEVKKITPHHGFLTKS